MGAKVFPKWLPDPETAREIVDVVAVTEAIMGQIKKEVGAGFAAASPLAIGSKGWSAPFNLELGKKALATTRAYQCAMNVFAVEVHPRDVAINWRNVVYLAEFYWRAKSGFESGQFKTEHFPHTVHINVKEPKDVETPWSWGAFH